MWCDNDKIVRTHLFVCRSLWVPLKLDVQIIQLLKMDEYHENKSILCLRCHVQKMSSVPLKRNSTFWIILFIRITWLPLHIFLFKKKGRWYKRGKIYSHFGVLKMKTSYNIMTKFSGYTPQNWIDFKIIHSYKTLCNTKLEQWKPLLHHVKHTLRTQCWIKIHLSTLKK